MFPVARLETNESSRWPRESPPSRCRSTWTAYNTLSRSTTGR